MKYVLYGPPGIGKSTMIKMLLKEGFDAIDLEDFPQDQRLNIALSTSAQFIAAADLHPSVQLGENYVKVLLTMKNQKSYDKRRAGRDKMIPEKASQRHHLLSDWKLGFVWDKKISVSFGATDTRKAMVNKFIAAIHSESGSHSYKHN